MHYTTHQPTTVGSRDRILKTLRADVVLGNPRQRCAGTGICKISVIPNHENCGCPTLRATLLVTDQQTIRFQFEKSPDAGAQARAAFAGPAFRIFCPVAVPREAAEALSFEVAFLRPGQYPIVETKTHFHVSIPVKGTR